MYKKYNTNQTTLPLELSALLPQDHLVFVIDEFIESLDWSAHPLFEASEGRLVNRITRLFNTKNKKMIEFFELNHLFG